MATNSNNRAQQWELVARLQDEERETIVEIDGQQILLAYDEYDNAAIYRPAHEL